MPRCGRGLSSPPGQRHQDANLRSVPACPKAWKVSLTRQGDQHGTPMGQHWQCYSPRSALSWLLALWEALNGLPRGDRYRGLLPALEPSTVLWNLSAGCCQICPSTLEATIVCTALHFAPSVFVKLRVQLKCAVRHRELHHGQAMAFQPDQPVDVLQESHSPPRLASRTRSAGQHRRARLPGLPQRTEVPRDKLGRRLYTRVSGAGCCWELHPP